MMQLNRFRGLLEAYGAEPRRWPPGERADAEELLARSPEARALLAEAAAIDALLDEAAEPVMPARDAEALIAGITATPQIQLGGHSPSQRSIWVKATGLAAAALIGFVVSWTQLVDMGTAPTTSTSAMGSFELAEDLSW
jgi:hypothetical protein